MKDKIFIDTNILVYSLDKHEPDKQKKARIILKIIQETRMGVLSTQVLQEFYVTATKKLSVYPLLAKQILKTFEHFEIVTISPEFIEEAIDNSIIQQLSFWDALILVSAKHSACLELWTEDLNDGQNISGVKTFNPFVHFENIYRQ